MFYLMLCIQGRLFALSLNRFFSFLLLRRWKTRCLDIVFLQGSENEGNSIGIFS